MIRPTWPLYSCFLLCHFLSRGCQVYHSRKSLYKIPWALSSNLFSSKYAVSIDLLAPGWLTTLRIPCHWWNNTMCMFGRWSCSCITGGEFLLNSNPYILHNASGGVTHLASLYCSISSIFPFSSCLLASLIDAEAWSWPLYMYLNNYFTALMLPHASTFMWQLKSRRR